MTTVISHKFVVISQNVMDKLVIDIETKDTFADVGGHQNVKALNVSMVGVYSYNEDAFFSFTEHELKALRARLQGAGLLIGFSMNRFDLPVLAKYFDFNLMALPRLDLLDEIELALGRRISLDILAKTNLGLGKTHQSLEAIDLYRRGEIEELKNYCLHDVKITRDLYDLARKQKFLVVPERTTGELVKASFNWQEQILPATLF